MPKQATKRGAVHLAVLRGLETRTLCLRHKTGDGKNITTDEKLVTCKFCLKLMAKRNESR